MRGDDEVPVEHGVEQLMTKVDAGKAFAAEQLFTALSAELHAKHRE